MRRCPAVVVTASRHMNPRTNFSAATNYTTFASDYGDQYQVLARRGRQREHAHDGMGSSSRVARAPAAAFGTTARVTAKVPETLLVAGDLAADCVLSRHRAVVDADPRSGDLRRSRRSTCSCRRASSSSRARSALVATTRRRTGRPLPPTTSSPMPSRAFRSSTISSRSICWSPASCTATTCRQVDMRVGKILRFGRTRTLVGVDIYNLFNANPV